MTMQAAVASKPKVPDRFRHTVRRIPGARGVVRAARARTRRLRRRRLARDLRRLHDALAPTQFAGRYAVCGGMLLGWARDGRLLLDDVNDADFVFDVADSAEFLAAVPVLIAAGFGPTRRYRNNDGDPVEYRFERHRAQFDFFVTREAAGRTRYFMFADGDELVCERETQADVAFEFLDRTWRKPEDHERALRDNYGDWRTPRSTWFHAQALTVVARRPARFGSEPWTVA